ncbi:MAG TPA: hypothetical protein VFY16_05685 [Gemmatimonadaceae bacterium]|nr:hypothetical protein [Gemmatimonadaceae bacterium]
MSRSPRRRTVMGGALLLALAAAGPVRAQSAPTARSSVTPRQPAPERFADFFARFRRDSTFQRACTSLGRGVGWGTVAGAAGTLTGLTVLAMCDEYCGDDRTSGMALHIGIGTVVGGAVGALVHHLRD